MIGGMSKARYVAILAGGRGERFWPQSRLRRPKQLLPIVGDKPMLAQTLERLRGLVEASHAYVITNEEQAAAVADVCPDIPGGQIVGEPVGRDTAPAVGLAATLIAREDPEATFAILPADAVVDNPEAYRKVLEAAFVAAERDDAIVTVGIKPTYAATGFGYLEQGEATEEAAGRTVYNLKRFVEKPDAKTAEEYLAAGNYFWNGGIFVWKARVVREQIARHAPDLAKTLDAIAAGLDNGQPLDALMAEHYPKLEKISVDYAIMEKADRVQMVEADFGWDDVGEWPALERHYTPDDVGNIVRGKAAFHDARNNIVYNDEGHLTAVLGLDDVIVVQTKDATLVCPKDRAQDLKKLVKQIEDRPDGADYT